MDTVLQSQWEMPWISGREQDRLEHCLTELQCHSLEQAGAWLRETLHIYSVHIQPRTSYIHINLYISSRDFSQYTDTMQLNGSYWDTTLYLTQRLKHWQVLDCYLTVYFKLPLHILPSAKAKQFTICAGVNVWHILSIFHFIWTKRQSSFTMFSTKVFQVSKQFSLYNCESRLYMGKDEEGARAEKPFHRIQPLSPVQ